MRFSAIAFAFAFSSMAMLSPSASSSEPPPSLRILAGVPDFDTSKATLSPDGELLAVAAPMGDRTGLVTLRLSDMGRVGVVRPPAGVHVGDIGWISTERLVFSLGTGVGDEVAPTPTGQLFVVDRDGSNSRLLVGGWLDEDGNEPTRAEVERRDWTLASLLAPVRDDPTALLIQTWRGRDAGATSQVERLDIGDRSRRMLASVPLRQAQFWLDHAQRVRFAHGLTDENRSRLLHRPDDASDWVVLNDEAISGVDLTPIGFSTDNATAYMLRDSSSGTTAVHAFDTVSLRSVERVRDPDSDPRAAVFSHADGSPIGIIVGAGVPRVLYFSPESDDAQLHRSVQGGFPGQIVHVHGAGTNRGSALVTVSGDRNPGEIYTLDLATRQVRYRGAAISALHAETLGKRQPFAFDARDGQRIHGYVTFPPGSNGRGLPMIVLPHGGPFGIHTDWDYDPEVQVLATRGYAVLEPDFRGSGGYGRAFEEAGHKQWGRRMQDDVTDATRWAIAQGIAAPDRICIHGSSYGAYSALMGVVREPDLYRCASGNIGVYDLQAIREIGDLAAVLWGQNYLRNVIDIERAALDSPLQQAGKIRVPVLLSAGAEDDRAPAEHTRRMRHALRAAGVPVNAKIYRGEGHGYVIAENARDYYTRLLDFFDRHIGEGSRPGRSARRD